MLDRHVAQNPALLTLRGSRRFAAILMMRERGKSMGGKLTQENKSICVAIISIHGGCLNENVEENLNHGELEVRPDKQLTRLTITRAVATYPGLITFQ
jgi:hypothetical protein